MTGKGAPPALRCVLFDFDGTIAETERNGHRVAYNRAFEELGLRWVWDAELYGELLSVAGGAERLQYFIERYRPEMPPGSTPDDLVREIHRTKSRTFADLVSTLDFRRGVQRLIREAHVAGVRIAIATTALASGVEAMLAQDPSVAPMIDLIAAGNAVERKKPEPDIYLWALERLGVRAADAVAIEDSHIGLRAARGAGLRTLVTPSDYTKNEDFTGAAAVLSDLGEPESPAIPLSGPAPAGGVVTLAYLQSLLTADSWSSA